MKQLIAIGVVVCLIAAGALVYRLRSRPAVKQPLSPVYVASGYGGFRKAGALTPGPSPNIRRGEKAKQSADPEKAVVDAYKAGDYKKVEQVGAKVVRTATKPVAARTKLVMAYSAALRKDLSLARNRFAELRHEASSLPKPERPAVSLTGESQASLEEEAAYQHAVCTAALGEKEEAEKEYIAFMKAYPESPLLHAAVKRVARFHGGNIPAEADAAWKQAMRAARAHEKARQKAQSMCGPECLAEVVRRNQWPRTSTSTIASLAAELGTDENGTTLQALIQAARKRGFDSRGLQVTHKRLTEQKLPVIALTQGSHFVLVEKVGSDGVWVWNPDGQGVGKPSQIKYTPAEWAKAWNGIIVTL